MKIKAKAKLDPEAIKALTHLSMFRREDPKKRMLLWTILYAIVVTIGILEVIFIKASQFLIFALCVSAFVLLLEYYWYFVLPKLKYNGMGKLKDATNEFVFGDSSFKIHTSSAEYNSDTEIEYSLLVKAFETSRYFFLYQTVNQVLIVDKSTVVDGSADEIRNRLMEISKDKYIICKY